jgi:hypothetical protein
MKLSFLLASSLVWHGLACTSQAELITVRFAGTVNAVSVRIRPELQPYDFPDIGDPFIGFYKFDSTRHDSAPESDQGLWYNVVSGNALDVSIADFRFEGSTNAITASPNRYAVGDSTPSIELTSDTTLAQILNRVNFSLSVFRMDLFPDPNLLPLIPPSPPGNISLSMDSHLNNTPGPWVSISATLEVLTVVPEPSGLLILVTLLMVGLPPRTMR